MGKMRYFKTSLLGSLWLFSSSLLAVENIPYCKVPDKRYILYLMSTRDMDKAIRTYLQFVEVEKKHDFKPTDRISLVRSS